jgi:predicted porin
MELRSNIHRDHPDGETIMTNKYTLKTLALVTALAAFGNAQAVELDGNAMTGLDASIDGAVSATGRFPTQAMEDQFNRYLDWVTQHNLDVTHAITPRIQPTSALESSGNGEISASGRFPTQAMEDQYNAFVTWTQASGRSPAEVLDGLISN